MKYFLDTNTCVYFLKGLSPKIIEKFKSKTPDEIKIPSIVSAELFYGAEKSSNRKKTIEIVEDFLTPFEIIGFGLKDAFFYGKIRAQLELKGQIIGPNDLIIASMVLNHGAKLVTNNTKEFQRVPSLKIENWV